MDIYKLALLIISVTLTASCASTSNISEQEKVNPIEILKFNINYYDKNVSILQTAKDRIIVISLPPIPGAIFGYRQLQHPVIINLNESEVVNTPIYDFIEYFNAFSASTELRSLEAIPSTTKVMRAGTQVTLKNNKEAIGTAGFVNNITKQPVMLVYFDRACHIKNTIKVVGNIYKHNIIIPKAGAYWVSADTIDEHTFMLKAINNNDSISFAIFPN